MKQGRSAERWLIVIGGALLSAAAFVPWVHVVLLGDLSLLQLLSAAKESPVLGFVPCVTGVSIILIELLAGGAAAGRGVVLALGSLTALLCGDLVLNLVHAVGQADGLAGLGIGSFATGTGCALVIVPAIVSLLRAPPTETEPGISSPRRPMPTWLPVAIAFPVAAGLAFLPIQSSTGVGCGTAVAVAYQQPRVAPKTSPPTSVQNQLDADQAAVDGANAAVAAQQQQDQVVQSEQANASTLAAEANTADGAASAAVDQASNDGDTVANNQNDIDNATSQLTNDQDQLQSDQQAGYDTSTDVTAIQQDEGAVASARQTLAADRATLKRDQAAASSLQADAKAVDQKAADAQSGADASGQSTSAADVKVQGDLTQAQALLTDDEQSWSAQYSAAASDVATANAVLSDCTGQADPRLIAAGVVALLGFAGSGGLALARRQTTSDELAA